MLKNVFTLLGLLYLILGCISNSLATFALEGDIGKFKVEITLAQNGDKFEGFLKYIEIEKPKIKLNGVIEQNILILYEFDNQNSLSGTFKGKFDSKSYKGFWYSPDKKQKVSFSFSVKDGKDKSRSQLAKEDTIILKPKNLIQKFFKPKKFKNDKSAYYLKEDMNYLVEFSSIE